jgi:mxaK protein
VRRRLVVHLVFAAFVVALAVPASLQGLRLAQAQRVNEAIAQAADPAGTAGDFAQARFAHALALARAGRSEAAQNAYKTFAQAERGPLRAAAFYNLGNLHLRTALRNGAGQATESLPLLELAKQAYRDALRADPLAWDARYNLEQALWLAPELDDQAAADNEPPVQRERAVTTAPSIRSDLP